MSEVSPNIRDAIVLCAGEGTEMRPISDGVPKSMLHLMGKSVLHRILEGLHDSSVRRVIVVHGSTSDDLLAEAKNVCGELGLEVGFAQQRESGVLGAVKAAAKILRPKLGGSSFLLAYGDIVASKGFYPSVVDAAGAGGYPTAAVVALKEPKTYGSVFTNSEGFVEKIVEKPTEEETSTRVLAGAFVLPPDFFEFCADASDFVDALTKFSKSFLLSTSIWNGAWVDLGFPWDLTTAASKLQETMSAGSVDSSAKISSSAVIEQPVVIEAGATIEHFAVIRGPAYIGRNAYVGTCALVHGGSSLEEGVRVGAYSEVSSSVIQPHTYIGTGCFIGNSVVGREVVFEPHVTTVSTLESDEKQEYARLEPVIREGRAVSKLGAIIGNRARLGVGSVMYPGTIVQSSESVPANTVLNRRERRRKSTS
ncbi:MAG: sugar phosphate nucleotidyltransferase [Thermoprotei archaeon]